MNGPCPYSCTNKTEFGYCKTTACLYAPTIKVAQKTKTQADRIRAMNDEELAKTIARKITGCYGCRATNELECAECVLEWLKKEVGNG